MRFTTVFLILLPRLPDSRFPISGLTDFYYLFNFNTLPQSLTQADSCPDYGVHLLDHYLICYVSFANSNNLHIVIFVFSHLDMGDVIGQLISNHRLIRFEISQVLFLSQ